MAASFHLNPTKGIQVQVGALQVIVLSTELALEQKSCFDVTQL